MCLRIKTTKKQRSPTRMNESFQFPTDSRYPKQQQQWDWFIETLMEVKGPKSQKLLYSARNSTRRRQAKRRSILGTLTAIGRHDWEDHDSADGQSFGSRVYYRQGRGLRVPMRRREAISQCQYTGTPTSKNLIIVLPQPNYRSLYATLPNRANNHTLSSPRYSIRTLKLLQILVSHQFILCLKSSQSPIRNLHFHLPPVLLPRPFTDFFNPQLTA